MSSISFEDLPTWPAGSQPAGEDVPSMETELKGQVTSKAAEIYERFFVPALLGQFTRHVSDAARLAPGDQVLDVACGTGALTRAALERVGPRGGVTGLDINEGMLAVARRKSPKIRFHQGPAEELAFEDGSFDAVVSQFGLMFFRDRVAALREMWRVLGKKGRLAVCVWGPLSSAPGYLALGELLRRMFGEEVAAENDAPFVLGDGKALLALFKEAGVRGAQLTTPRGTARFPSLDDWMTVEIKGWTLADKVDDVRFEGLLGEARREFAQFVQPDGTVQFPIAAHIVSAQRS